MIMAQRIAEHENVRLPVVVNLDGFTLTHSVQVVEPLPDEAVKKFVGEFKPAYPLLDVDNPSTWGPFAMPDYYFELKRAQQAGMEAVPEVYLQVQEEYSKLSGRPYKGFFEAYRLEDAERAIVVMGSTAGTAKVVVDELRAKGEKVGLLKVWLWRPFPKEEIVKALSHVSKVAVLDRAFSFGNMGALYLDVTSAFVHQDQRPQFVNYIYGLGGRDTTTEQLAQVFEELKTAQPGELRYIGLRE